MELTMIMALVDVILGVAVVVLLSRLYLEIQKMNNAQLPAQRKLETSLRQLLSENEGGALAPLARASEELIGAVNTLDQTALLLSRAPGLEWLGQLEQGIKPLGEVAGGLNGHYETSSNLLQAMESLLVEWSRERGTVASSARLLADEVTTLVTSETGARRQFADTLTEMVKLFNSSVNEMTARQAAVLGAINELSASIRNWQSSIDASTVHFQRTEEAYHRIVQKQEGFLESLRAGQADLDARHAGLSNAVRDLTARIEEIVKRQDDNQRAQTDLLHRQESFLAQFPERSQLNILIALQAVLTFVVLGIVVFGFVMSGS